MQRPWGSAICAAGVRVAPMSHEGYDYFGPRSWHINNTQRPIVWNPAGPGAVDRWGVPPTDTFMS